MRLQSILSLFVISLVFVQCQDGNPSESSGTVNSSEYKSYLERENKKTLKSIEEYALSHSNPDIGTLRKREIFDEKGQLLAITIFEIYGTDTLALTDEYSYDENGNTIEHLRKGNRPNYPEFKEKYIYDSDNLLTQKELYIEDKLANTTFYTYENENIIEERIISVDSDTPQFDKYSYQFDNEGRILEKIVTRFYPNGETLAFLHFQYEYNDKGQVVNEKQLNAEDGTCCYSDISYIYNTYGDIYEKKIFIKDDFYSMTHYAYNEFGEITFDSLYVGKDGYWQEKIHQLDDFGSRTSTRNHNTYSDITGYRYEVKYY